MSSALALSIPVVDLDVPVEIVVIGLITGLIYALLAVGLTLVYRANRAFNFAHADMGVLPAAVMAYMAIVWDVPYLLALGTALVLAVLIGALVELLVVRRLTQAPKLVLMVATIGVAQILLGFNFLIPRDTISEEPFPTPFSASVTIGDLRLDEADLLIVGVVPALVVALTVFLQRSRIGLASRAAAQNLEAARLTGVRARRVSVAIWVLAALLSVGSAVLLGPTRPITEDVSVALGPALMVRALAAMMLGGLGSLPQVFAGGVAIGLAETLVAWNYPGGGTAELVLFAIILLSLILRRGLGVIARGGGEDWSLGAAVHALEPRIARRSQVRLAKAATGVALIALAVLAPLPMSSSQRVLLAGVALFALMGLSLVLLTGYAGQVSLGQFAFVALGAAVGGRMFQLGYPWWVGVLAAAASGAAISLVVGLPALRLQGLFLAVTTLGFAVVMGGWALRQDWLVKVEQGSTSMFLPRQEWWGTDMRSELNYYWLSLGLLLIGIAVVSHLRRTGVGRALMAVRDNEPQAATLSVHPARMKLTAFALSGAIASTAGYFYGGLLVNFTEASLFSPEHSLALVALVIFGGVTSVTGAVLGALWLRGIPYLLGDNFALLSSGIGVVAVLQVLPGGLAEVVFRARDRLVGMLVGERIGALAPSQRALGAERTRLPATSAPRPAADAPAPLRAESVSVRFGGLTAVHDVSIELRHGEIVGLVGPNGAGKTTLFDVLSGQLRPDSGRVLLNGHDISRLRPEQRARSGLARTFQEARLFPDLSLVDTFKVALERHEISETVPSMLALPPSLLAERRKELRAEEIVELLGLEVFMSRNCGELSTGTRRLVELGCILALGCRVVILDEPTAGIAQREVEAFTPVMQEVREHLGASMLVIDHDLPMVMDLADRAYVMSAGALLAEGEPAAVREDRAVIAAYLGTDERVIRRSGSTAPPGRPAVVAGDVSKTQGP
jgi:ABC-type branched-subunit amino acid transport system ATPase component/branched-subunit amino acid ABC-type transport system permease component